MQQVIRCAVYTRKSVEEGLEQEFNTKELRLYVSDISTDYRFWTFLHDPPYRISLATENVGYNQPPQPGFYFGPDLKGHGIVFRGMRLP